jgi:hypothetical protein
MLTDKRTETAHLAVVFIGLTIGVLGEGGVRPAYAAGPWYVNGAGGNDANDCLASAPARPVWDPA